MSTKIATAILELKTDTGQIKSGLDSVVSQSKSAASAISGVGKALGIAFSVTAVVAAGKQFLDFAGNVNDLSNRLKVSTDTVQEWQAAFGQSGIEIGTVAKASDELTTKLVGGDKSAVAAIEKMGFSLEQLKAMKPEDRFNTVADAVGKIQDAGEQLYASKTLFGKGGPELLSALDGHLSETVQKIRDMGLVIDEETIKAADDFGDQLGLMGTQLLGIVGVIVGPLLPALSALGNALMQVGKFIGDALGVTIKVALSAIYSLGEAIDTFLATILEAAQKIPLLGKHLGFASGAIQFFREDAKRAGEDLAKLWTQTDKVGDSANTAKPKMLGLGGATEDAGKKARQAADEWARLQQKIDALNRANASGLVKAPEYNPAEGDLPEVSRLRAIVAAAGQVGKNGQILGIDPHTIEQSIANAGALGIEQIGEAIPPVIAKGTSSGFATAVSALPSILQQAFTGGGGFKGAFQAFASLVGSSFGEGLFKAGGLLNGLGNKLTGLFGDAFGLALPGIGSALGAIAGPLIGKLGSALKGLFGGPSKKELAGRDLEGQFEQSFGGFEDMMTAVGKAYAATGRTMEQAQADVKGLLDAEKQGPEAVQAWIDKINSAFDQQKAVDDGFSALEQAVQDAGGTMPASLQPMIDKLLEMGGLTDEQKAKLQAITGQGPNFEELEKRASDLGISLDALGPKFQQEHINAAGAALADTFHDLEDAGADVGGVIAGMSDEVNKLVQDAKKYGASIPEALRPVVENLLNTGNLVDENGNKIEDLSGISFKDTPLDRSSQAIVDAIDHLGDLFAGLPSIAQNAASGINNALGGIHDRDVNVTYHTNGDPSGGFGVNDDGSVDYDGVPATPMIRGGFGRVSRPRLFLAGEGGDEDVVFGGAGRNLARDVAAALSDILPVSGGDRLVAEIHFEPKVGEETITRAVHRLYERSGQMVIEARELLGVT